MEAKDKENEHLMVYLGSRKKKRDRLQGTPAIARKEDFGINLVESHFNKESEVLNVTSGDWVSFESVVDSGAAQSVTPSKVFFTKCPNIWAHWTYQPNCCAFGLFLVAFLVNMMIV